MKIFKETDFRCYDEIDQLKRIFYTFFVLKPEIIALNNKKDKNNENMMINLQQSNQGFNQ